MRTSLVDNRYRIEKQIGNDTSGVIYYAVDERTGADLAVKRLSRRSENQFERGDLRLAREYYLLAQCAVPNVVRVYDYGEDREGPYYTYEVLKGPRLSDLPTPIPYLDVCRYLYELSATLSTFHNRRIVLRNLYPQTIRVSLDRRIKLYDVSQHATFGVTGVVPIRPCYVAPETIRGEPIDQSTDLFSLGAIAYYLLTGRDAYPAGNLEELIDSWRTLVPKPSIIERQIPPEVDILVMSLINLSPASRPLVATEVAFRLQALFGFDPIRCTEPIKGHMFKSRYLGREREQNRLRARMQRLTRATSGGAKLIEGGTGLGKTRMLSETLFDAQVMGLRVIWIDIPFHRDTTDMLEDVSSTVYQAFTNDDLENIETPLSISFAPPQKTVDSEKLHYSVPRPSSLCLGMKQMEKRVRAIAALQQWLFDQSQQKPILLLVDNLQRADYDTMDFFLGLARQVSDHRMLLLITINSEETPVVCGSMQSLREICDRYKLRNLTKEKTVELLSSVLDDGPVTVQLAERLYDASKGNPLKCMDLVRRLVDRQSLYREDNSWKLRTDGWNERFCWELDAVYRQQVEEMGTWASEIIETLSVYNGQLSLNVVKELADPCDLESFFLLYDALVANGILVGTGNIYQLDRAFLRESLRSSLLTERLSQIHNRLGRILKKTRRDIPLQTSWHLVRSGEVGAAEAILMDFIARRFRDDRSAQSTIGSLMDLLDARQKNGDDDESCLSILFSLVLAGYSADRNISDKYAKRTFDALLKRASNKSAKWAFVGQLESRIAIDSDRSLLCIALITAQSAFLNYNTNLLKQVVRELEFRCELEGADPRTGERAYRTMVLRHIVVQYCRALIEQDAGRVTEACRRLDEIIEQRITDPIDLDTDIAFEQAIYLDAVVTRGLISCLCINGEASQYVEKLGQYHSRVANSAAIGLQTMYQYCRGETEAIDDDGGYFILLRSHRDTQNKIDRRLIEARLPVAALLRDHETVTKIKDQLGYELEMNPQNAVYHRAVIGVARAIEGKSAQAIDCFKSCASICEPGAHSLWGVFTGYHALALNELQEFEKAVQICREGMGNAAEDLGVAPLCFFELQLQLAVAEVRLGRNRVADERLKEMLVGPQKEQHPLFISAVYATRAEIAIEMNTAEDFVLNFEALWEIVRLTGNQAILNRAFDLRQRAVETGLLIHSASWGNSTIETIADRKDE